MKTEFVKASSSALEGSKKSYPTPITFRPVDELDRQRILRAAEGMSVGAYIRQCIDIAEGKKVRRPAVQDREELGRVLGLLGQTRIANNLNQLAYEAHAGSLLLDADCQQKIDEAYKHVCNMRSALVSALGLLEKRQK
ncbi:MAG: hypothetical protein ABJP66_07810 [Hyphomicrobiales bacterium]